MPGKGCTSVPDTETTVRQAGWESSKDFRQWTVKLRPGSRWSDGAPFTADDIVFWYKDVLLNKDLVPSLPSWMKNADGTPALVEKVSSTAARFSYKQPNTLVLTALANSDGGDRTYAAFLPAHYLKKFHASYAKKEDLDKLVAAAGFKTWTELFAARCAPPENPERPTMAAWVPATRVSDQVFTLKRNPYFVGVDQGGNQLPYLDEVHQVFLKEYAAQVSAIGGGEIHVMYLVPVEIIGQLKKDANVQVLEVPSPSFQSIEMFMNQKPFVDPKVRLAVKLAADRRAMLEASTGGHGVLGNDTPVPSFSKWYNKTLPQRERDVPKAKQLLAEAGYKNGLDLTLFTSTGRPGMEEAAVAFRESAKDAGIRVRLESVDITRLYSEFLRKPREFTMMQVNWFGRPTIDEMITPFMFTKSVWNFMEYSNPRVDALLTDALSMTDFDKRKRLYDETQKILHDEGPWLVAYFRNYLSAIRKNVRNYKLIPVQYVELRDVWLE